MATESVDIGTSKWNLASSTKPNKDEGVHSTAGTRYMGEAEWMGNEEGFDKSLMPEGNPTVVKNLKCRNAGRIDKKRKLVNDGVNIEDDHGEDGVIYFKPYLNNNPKDIYGNDGNGGDTTNMTMDNILKHYPTLSTDGDYRKFPAAKPTGSQDVGSWTSLEGHLDYNYDMKRLLPPKKSNESHRNERTVKGAGDEFHEEPGDRCTEGTGVKDKDGNHYHDYAIDGCFDTKKPSQGPRDPARFRSEYNRAINQCGRATTPGPCPAIYGSQQKRKNKLEKARARSRNYPNFHGQPHTRSVNSYAQWTNYPHIENYAEGHRQMENMDILRPNWFHKIGGVSWTPVKDSCGAVLNEDGTPTESIVNNMAMEGHIGLGCKYKKDEKEVDGIPCISGEGGSKEKAECKPDWEPHCVLNVACPRGSGNCYNKRVNRRNEWYCEEEPFGKCGTEIRTDLTEEECIAIESEKRWEQRPGGGRGNLTSKKWTFWVPGHRGRWMGDTALEELNKKNKGTYQLVPSGDGPNDSRVGKGRMSIPLERGIINDTTMEQKLCKALEDTPGNNSTCKVNYRRPMACWSMDPERTDWHPWSNPETVINKNDFGLAAVPSGKATRRQKGLFYSELEAVENAMKKCEISDHPQAVNGIEPLFEQDKCPRSNIQETPGLSGTRMWRTNGGTEGPHKKGTTKGTHPTDYLGKLYGYPTINDSMWGDGPGKEGSGTTSTGRNQCDPSFYNLSHIVLQNRPDYDGLRIDGGNASTNGPGISIAAFPTEWDPDKKSVTQSRSLSLSDLGWGRTPSLRAGENDQKWLGWWGSGELSGNPEAGGLTDIIPSYDGERESGGEHGIGKGALNLFDLDATQKNYIGLTEYNRMDTVIKPRKEYDWRISEGEEQPPPVEGEDAFTFYNELA